MYLNGGMACCAMDEISSLYENDTPESVIRDFASNCIDYNGEIRVGAFYVFSDVISVNEDREEGDEYEITDIGQRLADFIKDNKLGVVKASPARYNRLNHPSHKVKVWVWAPSVKGLTKWCSANNVKRRSRW